MIVIVFGIIMGIVHYFSNALRAKCKLFESQVISFSAGVAITYIFLELFPQFSLGVANLNNSPFLFVLLGFVLIHVVEKELYQHVPRSKLKKDLAIEASAVSFVYHFIIGIIAVSLISQGLVNGILFFIPILLYTGVSTLPVKQARSKQIKLIVASSTLLGTLFGLYILTPMSQILHLSLLGLLIGVLSYSSIRHSIPIGKKGNPLFFVLGVLFYTIILFMGGFI